MHISLFSCQQLKKAHIKLLFQHFQNQLNRFIFLVFTVAGVQANHRQRLNGAFHHNFIAQQRNHIRRHQTPAHAHAHQIHIQQNIGRILHHIDI